MKSPRGHGEDRTYLGRENSPTGHGDDRADLRGREKSSTVQEMIRLTQEEERTVLQFRR